MSKHPHVRRTSAVKKIFFELIFVFVAIGVLSFSAVLIWIALIDLPDFNNFENRDVANSTKIYDRTGKVVLYNIHDNIKRTEVPLSGISPYIINATISIEDAHFYEHFGFRPTSFARAVLVNLGVWTNLTSGFSQGGSTINQQVIKNTLLTRDKTITRKIKEIILAIKLDAELSKDEILNIYLNESPYGGTIYGVEEASLSFFNKHAKDVTLVEAAYLAALPQSPTYYSPFGKHRDGLEKRKNLVLKRMFELGYINENEFNNAAKDIVVFVKDESSSGKALHFVFFVREYLEQKYGVDVVQNGGLKVITTLDYELQKKTEDIVKEGALENAKKFKATNAALVAIDPRSGEILSMVGSRDFFDKEIPGQYNIAIANRQPGSSFKPIVYAAAFNKGYTPETVLFDVPTQFSTRCDAFGTPLGNAKESDCYMPDNYDGKFRGPISLRDALAQSLNIPAVKLLYLVGIRTAVETAQKMGLSTIVDPARYGLTLVLGGGEVTLLELTNAYGVFANNGVYSKPQSILEIRDADNNLLEKFTASQSEVLTEEVTSLVSNVLSDNVARTPSYGANSRLFFGERPVAVKTGTTNDYRDLWVIGYTPSIVIGMWTGNNDNTPIDKKVAGFVLAPVWHKTMLAALEGKPLEYFPEPKPNTSGKPILRGDWCSEGEIHSILKYVDRESPLGPYPTNPYNDPQFVLWETPIQARASLYGCKSSGIIFNSSTTVTN
jgi:penicillin-binding protein 1C